MSKYLYASFLEDKRVYNLAQAWWGRLLTGLASERKLEFRPYLNPRPASGRKEYDGNPICNAYFPTLDKAVRIIQEGPEEEPASLSAWLDTAEIHEAGPETPELVIALELSRATATRARALLRRWLVEDVGVGGMGAVITDEGY
jgi:hypothetical protein